MQKIFFILFIFSTFLGCSLKPKSNKTIPLREVRRNIPREGKRFALVKNELENKDYFFPYLVEKEGYNLIKNETAKIVGFEFTNLGKNLIVPSRYKYFKGLERTYRFLFRSRAKQDVHIEIEDMDRALGKKGHYRTWLYFFPRKIIPMINIDYNEINVRLPNEELVVFDLENKTLKRGVLKEGQVESGQGAEIEYSGKSILLKWEIGTGAASEKSFVQLFHPDGRKCEVVASKLFNFEQRPYFKYSNDLLVEDFLEDNCGFDFPDEDS